MVAGFVQLRVQDADTSLSSGHAKVRVHVNERCRRKKERRKQGRTNNKAKQHSTSKVVNFFKRKMSCIWWDLNMYMYTCIQ